MTANESPFFHTTNLKLMMVPNWGDIVMDEIHDKMAFQRYSQLRSDNKFYEEDLGKRFPAKHNPSKRSTYIFR